MTLNIHPTNEEVFFNLNPAQRKAYATESLADMNPAIPTTIPNALNMQVDGNHYKDLKIQPVEYIHANNLPFIEGSIVKYITRWRSKGGLKDLEKVKHFINLLIQLERLNPTTNDPSK
jgi:hypothetical protein